MAKKPQGQGSDSFEGNFFIIGAATVITAIILWMVVGRHYSALMGVVRRYEMSLFAPFFAGAANLFSKLTALNGNSLELGQTIAMLTKTGNYVRWLYFPLMVVFAIILYTKSYRGRFRRKHTMSSLAKQEAELWPEIAPVAGRQIEMVEGDITKGEWAAAMTEWEFATKHKLAKHGTMATDPATGKESGIKLDRDASRDVFISQLGPMWTGVNSLPVHTRALYAAFLLRIAGNGKESLAAFRLMSSTFAKGGLKGMDTSFADAAISAHGKHELVLMTLERHAYVFTVMATLQQISRADGVLASPMYLWLKTVDRRLWYTLNNVGRYAFHVECSGVMAHWLFEKTISSACPSPMVEKAIDGLKEALDNFTTDDSVERSFS